MNWFVYILQCSDGSFYVGHTQNMDQRLEQHNSGKGAIYTKHRRPVILLYKEAHDLRTTAIQREKQIKKWSRAKKLALITNETEKLKALSKRRHC